MEFLTMERRWVMGIADFLMEICSTVSLKMIKFKVKGQQSIKKTLSILPIEETL